MSAGDDPRTRMINLMYLVLMSLLALNVSGEVMNAFKIVNESFDESNQLLEKRNELLTKQFVKELKAQGEQKVGPFLERAESVNEECVEAINYLAELKKRLISESGGDKTKDGSFKEDDLDASTRLMLVQGEGPKLEKMLKQVRQKLLSYVYKEDLAKISLSFPLKISTPKTVLGKGETKDWSSINFRMMPSLGVLTIFSKFQNDVINSQGTILEYLLGKINAQDIKFDRFEPLVSANSLYLLVGQKFEAEIGVGAFSSTSTPEIFVQGQKLPVKGGKAIYTRTATQPGLVRLKVEVKMKGPDGQKLNYPKVIEYQVGIPAGVIVTADKVNVLYRGIPNPLTVTADESGSEQISIKVQNGIFRGKNGKYRVIPGKKSRTEVKVYVRGKYKSSSFFRVKDVPDPVLMVGNSPGGGMSTSVFKAEGGVRAVLKDFLFEGLRYQVLSYTISGSGAGFPDGIRQEKNRGPRWVGRARALVLTSRPGSVIQIEDTKVKGPDGRTRSLPPISFTLR